jgi:hypothetical protein
MSLQMKDLRTGRTQRKNENVKFKTIKLFITEKINFFDSIRFSENIFLQVTQRNAKTRLKGN